MPTLSSRYGTDGWAVALGRRRHAPLWHMDRIDLDSKPTIDLEYTHVHHHVAGARLHRPQVQSTCQWSPIHCETDVFHASSGSSTSVLP